MLECFHETTIVSGCMQQIMTDKTPHYSITIVTSQLSVPRLLVPVFTTRWRGDLEFPYCKKRKKWEKKGLSMAKMRRTQAFSKNVRFTSLSR